MHIVLCFFCFPAWNVRRPKRSQNSILTWWCRALFYLYMCVYVCLSTDLGGISVLWFHCQCKRFWCCPFISGDRIQPNKVLPFESEYWPCSNETKSSAYLNKHLIPEIQFHWTLLISQTGRKMDLLLFFSPTEKLVPLCWGSWGCWAAAVALQELLLPSGEWEFEFGCGCCFSHREIQTPTPQSCSQTPHYSSWLWGGFGFCFQL